jgi:hypothetical protein
MEKDELFENIRSVLISPIFFIPLLITNTIIFILYFKTLDFDMFEKYGLIISYIAVLIVLIFIFGRELVCWYFKINERIKILKDIQEKLNK